MDTTRERAAAAARLVGGWSVVRAADHTTRYVRLGAGSSAPVVVPVPATTDAALWPEVFESLAVGRRVFVPDLPDTEDSFASRLGAFLDGLGLSSVILVAPGSFCAPALEFALLHPERLQGLVLVPLGAADETGLSGTIAAAEPTRATSVLLVRRDTPAAAAMKYVSAFIARG